MTKYIVTREIHDNKTRELARVYLSRAVTTRWMPGALAPAHSSYRRCSSNSVSTRYLTIAITNLLITDVCTAGRDNRYCIYPGIYWQLPLLPSSARRRGCCPYLVPCYSLNVTPLGWSAWCLCLVAPPDRRRALVSKTVSSRYFRVARDMWVTVVTGSQD